MIDYKEAGMGKLDRLSVFISLVLRYNPDAASDFESKK